MNPSPKPRLHNLRIFAALVSALTLSLPVTASAQAPAAMDSQGHLVAMPFELDIPVVHTTVEHEGNQRAFVHLTTLGYQETLDHYRAVWSDRAELAPGWTIIGMGYDVGAEVYAFTVAYNLTQHYRLEVLPDEVSGGTFVTMRSTGRALNYRPRLLTVVPARAIDVGPVEITH